jgi:hypothetical protein
MLILASCGGSHKASSTRSHNLRTVSESVDAALTPTGWVHVDYKDVQISVPASWAFATSDCPRFGLNGGEVFLQGVAPTNKPCPVPLSSLTIGSMDDMATSKLPRYSEDVNSIKVYFPDGRPNANASTDALLPTLGVKMTLVALSLNSRILHTLTYSPRAVALATGTPPTVPSSWHTVTFAGLSIAVPSDWPVTGQDDWGSPTGVPTNLTFADLATSANTGTIVTKPTVILDGGTDNLYDECFNCSSPIHDAPGWDTTPISGLLVDSGTVEPSLDDVPSRSSCLHLKNVTVCPTANDVYGVLVLSVDFDGSTPVPVEIGLAGNGMVARTILYSIHTSDANPTDTTPTTIPIKLNPWPQQTIASAGAIQDIAPTSDGVYWLTVSNPGTGYPTPVAPVLYNPVTDQMTKGPSRTGFAGSPALTVTGGWVWMVVGVGDNALVEQLDPSTLALHRSESLPVKDNVNGWPVAPLLTATVDGPLWIAGGEDLWALDPTTGSVETEFDTGNEIVSMSTDPTGTLLYTSGQIPDQYGMRVTEYDAQTGQDLQRADKLESLGLAIGPGSVAATSSGVWVSIRTGMAGGAFELSAQSLSPIAPPPSKSGTFGTYEQFMGVGSSISEDTLWLTSDAQDGGNLTCADPTTGAVRASETTSVPVSAPIAIGTTLYAVASSGEVVVITPPAKCFG